MSATDVSAALPQLTDAMTLIVTQLRTICRQIDGGRGPVPHAINVAATHAQDALGALLIAQNGGSPGI